TFFFQAEDGIRDRNVTGVQTCALPISPRRATAPRRRAASAAEGGASRRAGLVDPEGAPELPADRVRLGPGRVRTQYDPVAVIGRSEERRVGKEGGLRWWPLHE